MTNIRIASYITSVLLTVGKLKLLYIVEKIGLPTRYLLATAVWGKVLPIVESWNNCRILAKLIHAPLKKHLASFLSKLKNWNKQIQLLLIPNTCDLYWTFFFLTYHSFPFQRNFLVISSSIRTCFLEHIVLIYRLNVGSEQIWHLFPQFPLMSPLLRRAKYDERVLLILLNCVVNRFR